MEKREAGKAGYCPSGFTLGTVSIKLSSDLMRRGYKLSLRIIKSRLVPIIFPDFKNCLR